MAAEQERIQRSHISLEIVEEIMVSLPVKSLLRFSTVSKSWNSVVFHSRFIKSHKNRGVSRSIRQIPTYSRSYSNRFVAINGGSCGSFSPLSVQCIMDRSPTFHSKIILRSSCHELWCVEFAKTIILWNPSMRTCREIPNSGQIVSNTAQYWLAYNSSRDDYNILYYSNSNLENAELYSLRNNSWKKIFPNLPLEGIWDSRRFDGGFGALHGILYPHEYNAGSKPTIVSFDLSTETYGEVAAPPYSPELTSCDRVEVRIVREKLCAQVMYLKTNIYVLWVMQDYGDGKSWSKLFEIDCRRFLPYSRMKDEDSEDENSDSDSEDENSDSDSDSEEEEEEEEEERGEMRVTALDFDGDGKMIVNVEFPKIEHAVMEVEKEKERVIFCGGFKDQFFNHLYVETLVSPANYGGGGGDGEKYCQENRQAEYVDLLF